MPKYGPRTRLLESFKLCCCRPCPADRTSHPHCFRASTMSLDANPGTSGSRQVVESDSSALARSLRDGCLGQCVRPGHQCQVEARVQSKSRRHFNKEALTGERL